MKRPTAPWRKCLEVCEFKLEILDLLHRNSKKAVGQLLCQNLPKPIKVCDLREAACMPRFCHWLIHILSPLKSVSSQQSPKFL